MLPLPVEATVEHAHGIVIDETDGTVIITYKDAIDPTKCLLRWKRDAMMKAGEFIGPKTNDSLCRGVPHGLIAAAEEVDGKGRSANGKPTVLYHANNDQLLHKTTMDGEILWTVEGSLNTSSDDLYSPTWFASQPDSPYIHMADGYGSSKIFVLDKVHGNYTGHSFGGHGSDHGFFQTCHSIAWDWRTQEMVVCDRENHRLEYFQVDAKDPSKFSYSRTLSFYPLLQRPCNIRIRPRDGYAIVPFLEGSVGILNQYNELLSIINITDNLGDQGFLHPHDASFVGSNGDFIVVTWNPGRIGYFRRVDNVEKNDGLKRTRTSDSLETTQ
jgi:hypothetical protein